MNHRPFVPHWHPTPNSESTREELDDESLKLEDVLDSSAIKKANNFRDARSSSSGLVEYQDTARYQEDEGVAHSEGERPGEVTILDVIRGELPLELRDDVDDLMEEEAKDANGEAYDSHHEPSVPVKPGWLLLEPIPVNFRVWGKILQRLVAIQHLSFFFCVVMVNSGEPEG